MKSKDIKIRSAIELLLHSDPTGQELIAYFENIPFQNLRRAIFILSSIYPGETVISDDEVNFIVYMFSNEAIISQESFFQFVSSACTIDYSQNQKTTLIHIIKKHIEILCQACTFELDNLMAKLFKPDELIMYMETSMQAVPTVVLVHFLDILRYEDFSDSKIFDERLTILKQNLNNKLISINQH